MRVKVAAKLTYLHIGSMLKHMRTTILLKDELFTQAKKEAARRGCTLTALIEQSLRLALVRTRKPAVRRNVSIPVCRQGGGTLPGVDLDDSADLLDRMEGRP
jgi:hypothetical protein